VFLIVNVASEKENEEFSTVTGPKNLEEKLL